MANNLVTRQNLALQAWIVPCDVTETGNITDGGVLYIESNDPTETLWYKTPTGTRVALGGEISEYTDSYVIAATLEGTVLHLKRNNSLSDVTVDLVSLQSGTGTTATLYSLSATSNLKVNSQNSVPSAVHTNQVTISVAPNYQIPTITQITDWSNHLLHHAGHLWVGQDLRTTANVQFNSLKFSDNRELNGVTYVIGTPGSDSLIPTEQAVREAIDAIVVSGGDNLGNHTATQTLSMAGNDISQVKDISPVSASTGTLSLPYQYWTIPTVSNTYRGDIIQLSYSLPLDLSFGDIVYFTKSSGVGRSVYLARADSTTTLPAVGMVIECNTSSVTILLRGIAINGHWNWQYGKTLFLSTSLAGQMTQTLGSKGDFPGETYIQVLGVSITNTLIYFNPELIYVDRIVFP